jgi:hypothetical protein
MQNQIIVPKIPEACKNEIFGASDIKWVKNVNDDGGDMGRNGPNYCSAYLNKDTSVLYYSFDPSVPMRAL